MPAGAAPQIKETVKYEFNGNSIDGWAFQDGTSTADILSDSKIDLSSKNGKFLKYTKVSDWGDWYKVSMIIDQADSETDGSGSVGIYLESKNGGDPYYGYRFTIGAVNNPDGTKLPSVYLQKRNGYGNDKTLATGSFEGAPEEFKSHKNDWYVEIVYNNGVMELYLRPVEYDGNLFKVLEATDASPLSGQIGLFNNNDSRCCLSDITVTVMEDITFLEVYRLEGNGANWILSGGAKFNSARTIIENSWDSSELNMRAIYHGHYMSGTYKLTLSANVGGSISGNVNYIYFNYIDTNNYYRITQCGFKTGGDTASVHLDKFVNGESTRIGTYEAAQLNRAYNFTIIQQDGKLNISYSSGGIVHNAFTDIAVDGTEGFVGVGTSGNKGTFSSIKLYGNCEDVSLKLETSDITDGAVNIPISGYSATFNFDKDLIIGTVDKLGMFVREKATQTVLPDSAYSLVYSPSTTPDCITLKFDGVLEYKTEYEVVISGHLRSMEYDSAVDEEELVISFVTVAPEFDVDAELTCEGAPVTDISEIAGKTVDFSLTVTNSGSTDKTYITSVCVFSAEGKLLTGKYYAGTAVAGNLAPAPITGSVNIAAGIGSSAKIVIYTWDGAESMNVLYPCIIF